MLLNHRIDIVISKEWVAQYVLQSEFTADLIAQLDSSPEIVEPPSYDYLLFSKLRPNAQNLMEAFNSGLKKLRASGRYDVILEAFKKGEYIKP
jgi:polar amino acid transport system substrate-binding protein